ncbi:C-C motif chemokine 2-like [Cebidichthys violaceus]|uniref:C-C motif chemokine 2-like n=1 Tax=Cebidichthys violaceus TaxID=271503 RepID=UPI0035CAF707
MSSRMLFVTLLLLSACLCVQSFTGNGRLVRKKVPCCTEVSAANISSKVIGNVYRKQSSSPRCPEAIIFFTQGGSVCVDPKAKWAKNLTANMTKV